MNWLPMLFRRQEIEPFSRLASFFGLIYSALVVGVSLYPFQNWRIPPDDLLPFFFTNGHAISQVLILASIF